MTDLRTTPTAAEASLVAENPSLAFGFFLKTEAQLDDASLNALSMGQVPVVVTEKSRKLVDGFAHYVVTTGAGLTAALNTLAERGTPVAQHLLLRDGAYNVPAYDAAKLTGESHPIRTKLLVCA